MITKMMIALLTLGASVAVAAEQPQMVKHRANAEPPKDSSKVIDWKAIDTNHDNLIEPAEMQRYLNKEWAKAKKTAAQG